MIDRFSESQKRELLRLVASLRSLMESSVALSAPLEPLAAMADAAEALSARAAEHAGRRPFEMYSAPVEGDLNTILPWSVISGPYHPMAAPVVMAQEGGKLVGTVRFGLAYEGPPGGVHGAVVAGVYDQVLAFAAMANHTPGHTATLTTKYRRITPLYAELRFEAWVERVEGRKVFTRGRCHAEGDMVTEAEALFIRHASSTWGAAS